MKIADMNTVEDFKNSLQERFTEIAYQSEEMVDDSCGCGSGCGCHGSSDEGDYQDMPGYHPEAGESREDRPEIESITISAEKPCCHAGEEDHVCCGGH
jgi:hypothetical protein